VALAKNDLKPLLYDQNSQIDDYELIAIVMHHGATVSSGHYTAYVRELDSNDVWYVCDDSSIMPVGATLKMVDGYNYEEDGYLLFYMKKTLVKHVLDEAIARKNLDNIAQALASLAQG
jgi:ubiquitin carboxyl-terminal hydrolase 36/42